MKTLKFYLAFGALSILPAMSSATILNFNGLGLSNYGDIPNSLGSYANTAVNGVSQGSAWTPNVGLSMSTVSSSGTLVASNLDFWSTSYGDLTDVAFATATGNYARVNLVADAGYFVTINSFDLGAYPQSNLAADRIRIYDGSGNVLWNQDNTTVAGSGPSHSSYSPNITGSTLILEYGSNWNIGLDNLNFTQAAAVPEPFTLGIVGVGLLGLMRRKSAK